MTASTLVAATERALAAATHLTVSDAGAVEALRAVARKIDAWDVIVDWALADAGAEGRPKVPQNDNVSLPTYLKFCESLGLTPAGRVRLPKGEEKPGGKVDELKAKRRAKRSA
jgi:hypothetical protein